MKSIVLIVPYIGKWPFWFDAYLLSIAKNPTINWVFITDCKVPDEYPKNIYFIKITQQELNTKVDSFFEISIPLTPRKICDLRPAFGDLFSDYIEGYDFWGFCDLDIIWGNIRSFLTKDDLENNDIISSRKHNTSGHFTIFKNDKKINSLYKSIPEFKLKLAKAKLQRIDEDGLTEFLWQKMNLPTDNFFNIKWDTILCNQENGRDSHQEYYLNRWLWRDGKMINTQTQEEVMYLHFINWKRTMKYSEIIYSDKPQQFYISYSGMHYNLHSKFKHCYNNISNVFNGYYINEKRRYRKNKIKSLIKRVKRKLKFN